MKLRRTLEILLAGALLGSNGIGVMTSEVEAKNGGHQPQYGAVRFPDDHLYAAFQNAYARFPVSEEISRAYVMATIMNESSWNPLATGAAGERGLMQVMPSMWKKISKELYGKEVSYDLAYDPQVNVEVGIALVKSNLSYLKKNHPSWNALSIEERREQLAAAYNGGAGSLKKAGFQICWLRNSTLRYIRKMNERMMLYEALLSEREK